MNRISGFRSWCLRASLFAGLIACLGLTACTGLAPGYQTPEVNLTSFALAPESQGGPRFNIGLQIVNPNRGALSLVGMSYSVEVEGNRVLSGAQNDLPTVPAYGTADITIVASPNLLGGARLIADMMSGPGGSLDYTFRARVDAGGTLRMINVEESGSFSLTGRGSR